MENHQKDHIRKHLVELIKSTMCNTHLMSRLTAAGILGDGDVESLEVIPKQASMEKSKTLYSILQTKVNAYAILIQSLEETRQSGAVQILQDVTCILHSTDHIKYDKNHCLGTGSSGKVFKGTFDNRDVAVKVINSHLIKPEVAIREVNFLKKLDSHENIVRYYFAESRKHYIYIAIELCQISVQDEIKINLINMEQIDLLRQCTIGLSHLHQHKVIHRDLKPANVLITNYKKVKISDFGLSKQIPVGKTSLSVHSGAVGTADWMAPEVLGNDSDDEEGSGDSLELKLSTSADVFSLGCIFFFVLSKGSHPFGKGVHIQSNICRGRHRLQSSSLDKQWLDLIRKMIDPERTLRPSCETVLNETCFRSGTDSLANAIGMDTSRADCIADNVPDVRKYNTGTPDIRTDESNLPKDEEKQISMMSLMEGTSMLSDHNQKLIKEDTEQTHECGNADTKNKDDELENIKKINEIHLPSSDNPPKNTERAHSSNSISSCNSEERKPKRHSLITAYVEHIKELTEQEEKKTLEASRGVPLETAGRHAEKPPVKPMMISNNNDVAAESQVDFNKDLEDDTFDSSSVEDSKDKSMRKAEAQNTSNTEHVNKPIKENQEEPAQVTEMRGIVSQQIDHVRWNKSDIMKNMSTSRILSAPTTAKEKDSPKILVGPNASRGENSAKNEYSSVHPISNIKDIVARFQRQSIVDPNTQTAQKFPGNFRQNGSQPNSGSSYASSVKISDMVVDTEETVSAKRNNFIPIPKERKSVTRISKTVSETPLVQSNSQFWLLHEVGDWIKGKQKQLQDADYGSDLPSVQAELEKQHKEHGAIEKFQSSVDKCGNAAGNGNELKLYIKYLNGVQKSYAELLMASKKRTVDLETLMDFVDSATSELIWQSEKEKREITRDWSSTSLNLVEVEQYYEALMSELVKRETQFNAIQDRGESLVLQHHPASKCIETYMTAMQTQWACLLQLTICLKTHLKHVETYRQYFSDTKECEQTIARKEEILNTVFSKSDFSLDEGNLLLTKIQELREDLTKYGDVIHCLSSQSREIIPLNQRVIKTSQPLTVIAICNYKQNNQKMVINKDERCTLLDNSQRVRWRVTNSSGLEETVPSVCFIIPPPDKKSWHAADRIRKQYDKVVTLWATKHLKLRQNIIFATIKSVRNWDVAKLLAVGSESRIAIRKALHDDVHK